jgi:hypothetical protein
MEVLMAKNRKVPKRIAGVKIPKAIRKGPIGDFLSSSGGQVMLAEVLLGLVAVYAARRFDGSPTRDALRHPLDSLRAGRDWSRGTTERFIRAFGAGVQAFREAMHESEGAAEASGLDTEPDHAGRAKKKRSSRSEAPLQESGSSPH